MSDGPSTWNRRITKTCFRTCSTCKSRSQAPLCLYTQHAIANRVEGTFVHLRYFLGGNRPSQTTHQTLSSYRIHGRKLEPQHNMGGIPRMTPRQLASPLQSLPPILYIPFQNPMSSCSKGSGVFPSCRG